MTSPRPRTGVQGSIGPTNSVALDAGTSKPTLVPASMSTAGLEASALLRFWAKVDPCRTDGCALWLAYLNEGGYGQFKTDGRLILAHHFLTGRPPEGTETDHLCRIHNCVWPEHLEFVTRRVNVRRGFGHGSETHCPQGHPYDEANTYRNKSGFRACRECHRVRVRNAYAKGNAWRALQESRAM